MTTLTPERIAELKADAVNARAIVGKLCSELRCPKMSIPTQPYDEDMVLCRVLDAAPALIRAAEQNVKMREAIEGYLRHDAPVCALCKSITVRSGDIAKCLNCGHERNWWVATNEGLRNALKETP